MNTGASSFLRLRFLVCTLAAVGAHAQPMMTLQFCNDCLPSPPDRLVRDVNGNPLVGTNYVAQLYFGASPDVLAAHTAAPARFRPPGTPTAGTWLSKTINLTGFAPGALYLQVRVWDTTAAATYDQAAASATGHYGRSETFVYNLCPPPTLPPVQLDCEKMLGFRGFTLMSNPADRVLVIREVGDRVELLYSGAHTIEAAAAITGPWTTIHSSTAPFIDPSSRTNNVRFYRMRDEPGPTYSFNAVGYYRLNLCAGYTMIANQLRAPGGNALTNIFKSPPHDTQLFKYTGGMGYDAIQFIEGFGWSGDDTSLGLNPGEGAFIYSPGGLTHTFLGDVPLSASLPIPTGWSILSSPVPQGAPFTDEPPSGLGFPVRDGDQVYQWRCGNGYISNEYVADVGWTGSGDGATPVINLGESFFFFRNGPAGPGVWNRTFGVGQ